jgi:hypothetical protein
LSAALKEDRLASVAAIAEYVGTNERRVRHLIALHGFPHKKIGNLIESRRSWIDQFYAEPDPSPPPRPQPTNGARVHDGAACAAPGCTAPVMARDPRGRPPKFCLEHRRSRRPK